MSSGCSDDCGELWMCGFGAAEVTWMVHWKSSCDKLWTCGCVAVAGSGMYDGLETWMRRVENRVRDGLPKTLVLKRGKWARKGLGML
jgi:hypothetical protein